MRSWIAAAQQRAQRRKSPWNLLLLGGLPLWALFWWAAFRVVWAYHVHLYPGHAGALGQFWRPGITGHAFFASFLMVFGPMVPALVFALLLVNTLIWLVPPARRTLEAEARTVPGTDFLSSQRKLLVAGVVALVVGAALAERGAAMLSSLQ